MSIASPVTQPGASRNAAVEAALLVLERMQCRVVKRGRWVSTGTGLGWITCWRRAREFLVCGHG